MGRKKKPDRLARRAAEAKALGMSYGNYVAKYHPPGSPREPAGYTGRKPLFTKNCLWCGTLFQTTNKQKIYCNPDCGNAVRNRRKYEQKLRREKEEKC